MRRLFKPFFKAPKKDTKIEVPSLPADLPYSDFNYIVNRGYLAKKIGQYLELNNIEADQLFYLSLSKESFSTFNKENKKDYILYLSEQLLKWHDQQQDISQKVKELPLNNYLQNVLLKTYEIHKKDIFVAGVTSAPNTEKVDGEWEIYRDVMNAATQGQFLLISEAEIGKYKIGIELCEWKIIGRQDIPLCRKIAKERLEARNFNKSKIMSWLLVLSEAITNIIKHAEQGKMTILESKENNEIRFVIEDKGPGFPLKELPKNTLLAGYSTKNSMGQGFTLMMKMAKQVLLCSTPKGSTLILIFDSSREKAGVVNATC